MAAVVLDPLDAVARARRLTDRLDDAEHKSDFDFSDPEFLAKMRERAAAFELERQSWPNCAHDGCTEKVQSAWMRCPAHEAERSAIVEAQIPDRYRWATFDAPLLQKRVADPRAIQITKAWPQRDRLVFVADAGKGKTSLACAALRACIAEKKQSLFVDSFALAAARRNTRLGSEAELIEHAMSVRVLLLDDLGSEPRDSTEAVSHVLFERHQRSAPTILTTWMAPLAVAERYGAGIARRVFEGATQIRFNGGMP